MPVDLPRLRIDLEYRETCIAQMAHALGCPTPSCRVSGRRDGIEGIDDALRALLTLAEGPLYEDGRIVLWTSLAATTTLLQGVTRLAEVAKEAAAVSNALGRLLDAGMVAQDLMGRENPKSEERVEAALRFMQRVRHLRQATEHALAINDELDAAVEEITAAGNVALARGRS